MAQIRKTTLSHNLEADKTDKIIFSCKTRNHTKYKMAAQAQPSTTSVVRRRRAARFTSNSNEIIAVDVDKAVKVITKEILKCYKKDGKLRDEIGTHPILPYAEALYKKRQKTILSVPQSKSTLEKFKKEDIHDIHVALIAYTLEEEDRFENIIDIYRDFNTKTRELMTGKITSVKYPYTIYLTHLWVGATYLVGSPRILPKEVFRGVTGGISGFPIGKRFAFPQFISTSSSLSKAKEFGSNKDSAIFKILCTGLPAGSVLHCIGMDNHSAFVDEKEFLFSPAHEFVVKGISKDAYNWTIIECTVKTAFAQSEL